jgi:hypothetical protein
MAFISIERKATTTTKAKEKSDTSEGYDDDNDEDDHDDKNAVIEKIVPSHLGEPNHSNNYGCIIMMKIITMMTMMIMTISRKKLSYKKKI